MASRVTVHINSRDVYKAIGTPGGPVYNWREATAEAIVLIAKRTAPENTPGNAAHRGGGTGGFKRGFDWEPYGNQHVLGARIYNDAPHAIYAELGRGDSWKVNKFSTSEWKGDAHVIGKWGDPGARGWEGNHTLRDAVNAVMPTAVGGPSVGLS